MTAEQIEASVTPEAVVTPEADAVTPSLLDDAPITEEIKDTEIKDEGNIEDFINSIGDDYKSLVAKKGFKSPEDVLKSYSNLESMLGKKIDDMTDDEVKSVYQRFGAPESKEGYEFEEIEIPEGAADLTDWFADKALELGLSKTAANELRKEFTALQSEQMAQYNEARQVSDVDNINTLKQEFGSAFDERVSLAKTALNEFGGDDVKAVLREHGLTNNAALVKMFSELGKLTSESKMVADETNTTQFGTTPAEAAAKIASKFADKEFMRRYEDQTHVGHQEAVNEILGLYKLKNSG